MKFRILCIIILILISVSSYNQALTAPTHVSNNSYWFLLQRDSQIEYLFLGEPGNTHNSFLVKIFPVKTGVKGMKPTPLPYLAGRSYWVLTSKTPQPDNPETAPYFLTLNVPVSESEPYGPTPYLECNGQCNWEIPGAFGLHGVGGDLSRISSENPGSSGCIRHTDDDITFLYNLLEPDHEEIRYYVEDSTVRSHYF